MASFPTEFNAEIEVSMRLQATFQSRPVTRKGEIGFNITPEADSLPKFQTAVAELVEWAERNASVVNEISVNGQQWVSK